MSSVARWLGVMLRRDMTVFNILCFLRNDGFPSFCLCASLFVVCGSEASPPFEILMATVGRMVFFTFDVCV